MTHPIIKTENYLLVVKSGIKEGETGLSINNAVYTHCHHLGKDYGNKIIFHLPLNNASTLEGVPLLPPLELAKKYGSSIWDKRGRCVFDFMRYKYTEEDLRKCWKACLDFNKPAGSDSGINLEDFIQSLQQPKYPVAFESAMGTIDDGFLIVDVPKTITNSQGLTQLVGKYIYL
jgi:hypothetical protein